MFEAGISAGFFIFERTRLAGGALIMVSICVMVYTCFDLEAAEKRRLAAFLAAGFVLFTCRYISYGCSLVSDGSSQSTSSDSNRGAAGAEHEERGTCGRREYADTY